MYTPDSPLRRPGSFSRALLRDVRGARFLAWRLIVRDISAQYRQTALGYFWAVLPPVVTAAVWVLLNKSQIVTIDTGEIPYPVFVLTGTTFWQLFLDALNAPLKQLSGNRSMLNRVNFPPEALLLSGIGQVLFSFLIKLVVLAVAFAAYRVPVEWTAILVVFPIAALLAIGTVVGVLISPFGLLYRDVEQGLLVAAGLLMFLTPVLYPPPQSGAISTIMHLNPLTPIFDTTRALLFGIGGASYGLLTVVLVTTFILALAGWMLFRLALPILIERLEA